MPRKAKKKTDVPSHILACGDEFVNPIPTSGETDKKKNSDNDTFDKNHWKVVFESHREHDEKQCAVWKDEVNTLLIFAGLFSAVVTAFLIESYKFLLPQDGSNPSKFAPNSPHVIRLNSLWFCSLVLALSSAVIGIVALQWIRNHERYDKTTPRDALSMFEMRTKALRKWHIRWVFLSLPLLVLVALVLFFVGLVDFLLSLNKEVVAPVAVLVYTTLALLLITTVVPSLQILWLSTFPPTCGRKAHIPTPCPWKSAQSLILHRSISWIFQGCRYLKGIPSRQKATGDTVLSLRNLPLFFMFYVSPTTWIDYDTKWLRLRDTYSQAMESSNTDSQVMESNGQKATPFRVFAKQVRHPRRPIYDEAQILIQTITGKILSPGADVIFAAYHCFQEVSKNALYDRIERTEDNDAPKHAERNRILRGHYWKHLTSPTNPEGKPRPAFGAPISDIVANPSTHLLHEENMFVFLGMHTPHGLTEDASRVISAHLSELHGRILAYVYAAEPSISQTPRQCCPTLLEKKPPKESGKMRRWLFMMSQQNIDMISSTRSVPNFKNFKIWSYFVPRSLNGNDIPVETDTIERSITQFSLIFERFLQHASKVRDDEWKTTIYTDRDVTQFVKAVATMFCYMGSNTFLELEKSLDFIQKDLEKSFVTNSNRHMAEKKTDRTNTDYLFLVACYLIEQASNPYAQVPMKPLTLARERERMVNFVKVLRTYELESFPSKRIQDNWTEHWSDTGFPKGPSSDYAPDPTTPSYIRWKSVSAWIKVDSHFRLT